MKRIISVVLAVSMTASLLTGCIGGQNTGRTRTERERRHDITAESVEGTGVGNISDTIEAESDGEMIFDTAEAGVEPETDTWTGDENGEACAARVPEQVAPYLEDVQKIAMSVAQIASDGNYSFSECASYCGEQLDQLEAYYEAINEQMQNTAAYSGGRSGGSSGDDGSEALLQRVNASIDEIYSLTDFIGAYSILMEYYLEGIGNDAETSADYYTVALNTWAKVKDSCSQIEAPKAVGDAWIHFQDSMQYYYEALAAAIKAMPDDEIEDTLAMYTAISLSQRNTQMFNNYYNTIVVQAVSGLTHQIEVIDGLIGGLDEDKASAVNVSYEMTDNIMPNLYPSMDSALNLCISTNSGTREVIVSAEIEGFTQKYEKKITVTPENAFYMIKPQIALDTMDLNTSRTTQFDLTLTDASTGEVIVRDTQPVTVESIYDICYYSNAFGTTENNNILAWITAESEGVLTLRRNATQILGELLGSENATLPGYQPAWGLSSGDPNIAAYQIYAIQCAISAMGVRYNNGAYSFSNTQRVLMPDAVLSSGSGICIETAILMASAVLSAGMHPLIILTPGHAQVAVETWTGSGQYLLVETTMLPCDPETTSMTDMIALWSDDEWAQYLSTAGENGTVYVLDCDLQKALGIKGLDYYAQ